MRKTLIAIALLCAWAGTVSAQVSPLPFVKPQFFDSNGRPCAGCKLQSFIAGTSTPQATYSDPGGVFPNANPVILDAAGRANIYLTANGYKLILQTAGGSTIWSVDNIVVSAIALLSSNNTWTGINTFNAATTFNSLATFNAGITSSGPNVFNGGGTLQGTWLGSPTFSGTPNFSGGFLATTGTFSGQIISTITTGSGMAPFNVSSIIKVTNLNADLLDGCDFADPCPLGSDIPSTGAFTTLVVGGGTPLASSNQTGTGNLVLATNPVFPGFLDFTEIASPSVPAAGTTRCYVDSTSHQFTCKNTSGTYPLKIEQGIKKTSGTCTTGSSSFDHCNDTLTWPVAFPDATHLTVSCSGIGGSDPRGYWQVAAYSQFTVTFESITGGTNPVNYNEIHCQGIWSNP